MDVNINFLKSKATLPEMTYPLSTFSHICSSKFYVVWLWRSWLNLKVTAGTYLISCSDPFWKIEKGSGNTAYNALSQRNSISHATTCQCGQNWWCVQFVWPVWLIVQQILCMLVLHDRVAVRVWPRLWVKTGAHDTSARNIYIIDLAKDHKAESNKAMCVIVHTIIRYCRNRTVWSARLYV